jgi:hypothetical protein
MHRSQSVSLCNDSVIVTMIHEMYNDLMNRYNISATNRYNGLERIAVGSIELKCYNDSSNRYTFHESL